MAFFHYPVRLEFSWFYVDLLWLCHFLDPPFRLTGHHWWYTGLSKSFYVAGWWWIVGGFGTHTKGTGSLGLRKLGTFWKFKSQKWREVFQEVFSTTDTMLFHQNTHKTGNNAVEMSQAFQDIPRFKHFTGLNLFKYALKLMLYNFIRWCLFFVSSYGKRRWK